MSFQFVLCDVVNINSGQIDNTKHIQFEQLPINFQGYIFEEGALRSTGIVHQNIDATEIFYDFIKMLFMPVDVQHVHWQYQNVIWN